MSDRTPIFLPEDAALRAIAQGVEAETGDRFFASLAQNLALALAVQYAFVTQLSEDGTRFKMLAVWERDHFGENIELPLTGTPCESVLHGEIAHYAHGLCALFPQDKGLVEWGAESYCGVPVFDAQGRVFGHVAIVDDKPMTDGPRGITVMRIFAARVRAEIERLRMERALRLSEQRYRELYEGAPVPFVSATRDGRLVRWNRKFVEWSRYSEAQLRRLNALAFAPQAEPERQVFLRRYEGILSGREVAYDEQPLRLADGSLGWAAVSTRAIRDQEGRIVEAQTIISDITDRKRAEEALRVSEERLARVIDSAMDAIVTFDSSHRIELFNGAAENIFKIPAGQALGASLDRFLTDGLRRALEESMQAFGGGAARPYVWAPGGLTAKRADGSEFPIEATVSHFEVGTHKLYTLILRDVDERRRAEAELRELGLQNEYLQEEIKQAHNFEEIVGQSAALNAVLNKVRLVAATDSTVLILGETGTGKELIARAIHSASARRDRPLIKVNCAALPAGLIESELFGHERGAFTGAIDKRIGRFELANGGTLFLDEMASCRPKSRSSCCACCRSASSSASAPAAASRSTCASSRRPTAI